MSTLFPLPLANSKEENKLQMFYMRSDGVFSKGMSPHGMDMGGSIMGTPGMGRNEGSVCTVDGTRSVGWEVGGGIDVYGVRIHSSAPSKGTAR